MTKMESIKLCLACNKKVEGRSDKKFCDPYCKSAYHYKLSQESAPKFYNKVENQLKLNRKILKEFNRAGKATVRAAILIENGFNSNFFTHYWKNKKGDVYLFVYEYGFLRINENGREKFVLISWQEYMNKNKF
tara:strand:+ start:2643 stop:3041 length:399 start_codon:yes stop_codon:yes gene_type:complete